MSGSSGMRSLDHLIDDERYRRAAVRTNDGLRFPVAGLRGRLTRAREARDDRYFLIRGKGPARDHAVGVAQRELTGDSRRRMRIPADGRRPSAAPRANK